VRGGRRPLSEAAVAEMTRDQLTAAQKAASSMFGLFEQHGWGFGMAVVTGTDASGARGAFGWDGGMGTSWRVDPTEQAVRVLLTQRSWTSPVAPPECRAFWSAARA
jgi:CubicO group peptidase (beta-lactamase class C family)